MTTTEMSDSDKLGEIAYAYNGLKAVIRAYQHAANMNPRNTELLDGLVTAAEQSADRIGQLSEAI